MSEIVNMRRVKKAKARTEKSTTAEANRAKHGVAKQVRNLAKARAEKEKRTADAHELDKK
ncbi:MAG TPA: DUF4169 family protein [Rhizomicrobium sp.]|jgi:hypothetical protein|nr:DUF4169 family protein [Rhizomicrobium sp.]